MRIKKYVAASMREALLQIKDELGEDAIILKTRKLPKKVFALGSQDEIEVTAAIDEEVKKRPVPVEPLKVNTDPGVYARPRPSENGKNRTIAVPTAPIVRAWTPPEPIVSAAKKRQAVSEQPVVNGNNGNSDEGKNGIVELKEDIRLLRDMVNTAIEKGGTTSAGGFSGGWAVLYNRLIDSEVKPQIAENLIRSINDSSKGSGEDIEKQMIAALSNQVPVSGPLRLKKDGPLVVAFVGPTGAGKTTTLAKLAAHCCINKGKSVSIITADTYRIAAIEQIRMFADIVKIGLQVVFSPDEIPQALEASSNSEVVFVDTAGRSQRNQEHMEDLRKFLDVLRPDEVHLVLSASTKDSDLLDTIRRYKNMSVNRLLFTKIDETVRLGNVLNVVSESGIPVSYFTMGQSVPDDIELAQAGKFVQQLWEGGAS